MTMTSERVPLFPQEKVQDEPTLLKEKVSMGEQELRKLMEDKELTPELKESFFRGMTRFQDMRKNPKIQEMYDCIEGIENPDLKAIKRIVDMNHEGRKQETELLIQKIVGDYELSEKDRNLIVEVHNTGKGLFLDGPKTNDEKRSALINYFESKGGNFTGKGKIIARVLMDYGICGLPGIRDLPLLLLLLAGIVPAAKKLYVGRKNGEVNGDTSKGKKEVPGEESDNQTKEEMQSTTV